MAAPLWGGLLLAGGIFAAAPDPEDDQFDLVGGSGQATPPRVSAISQMLSRMDGGALVNEFTGQAAFSTSLGGIQNHHGLGFQLNLSYFGSRLDLLNFGSHLHQPTSWVGLGFTLEAPKIVVSGGQSTLFEDQKYYLSMDGHSQNELIPIGSDKFVPKNDPFTTVTRYTVSLTSTLMDRCPNQINQSFVFPILAIDYWKVEAPNGTTVYFGEPDAYCDESRYELCLPVVDHNVKYQPYYDVSGSAKTPQVFYAQKFVDRMEKFAIWLDYHKNGHEEPLVGQCNWVINNLNPSNRLDRAIYLKEVFSTNGTAFTDPKTAQLLLHREPKADEPAYDPVPGNPMAFHEKERLQRVEHKQGGITTGTMRLSYSSTGNRMRLRGIVANDPVFGSTRPHLDLEYDQQAPWRLVSMTDNAGKIAKYEYAIIPTDAIGTNPQYQDLEIPGLHAGDRVAFAKQIGSKFYLQIENWEVGLPQCFPSPVAACFERLYEYENRGTYWALKRTFTAPFPRSQGYMDFYIAPDGSYFIWAYPKTVGNIDVLQMHLRDLTTGEANPPVVEFNNDQDGNSEPRLSTIYTFPQWFAVHNFSFRRAVSFYHKDAAGTWRGIDQCPAAIAPDQYAPAGPLYSGENEGIEKCLEFDSPVTVQQGPNFLTVVNDNQDILHVYGYDGGIKDFVRGLEASTPTLPAFTGNPAPPTTARPWHRFSANYHNNWQKNIVKTAVSENVIVVLSQESDSWYYLYALGWDGRQLRYLYDEPQIRLNNADVDAIDLYAGKDYFIVKNAYPGSDGIFHYKVDTKLWAVTKTKIEGVQQYNLDDLVIRPNNDIFFIDHMQQGKSKEAYSPAYVSESAANGEGNPVGSTLYPHAGEVSVYALNQDRSPVNVTSQFRRETLLYHIYHGNCNSSGDRVLCAAIQQVLKPRSNGGGSLFVSTRYVMFRKLRTGYDWKEFDFTATPADQYATARLVAGGVMRTLVSKSGTTESLLGLRFYPDPFHVERLPSSRTPAVSVVSAVKVLTNGPASTGKDLRTITFSYPESDPESQPIKRFMNTITGLPNFKVVRQDLPQGAKVTSFTRDDAAAPLPEGARNLGGMPEKTWLLPDKASFKKPGGGKSASTTVSASPVPGATEAVHVKMVKNASQAFFHRAHQDAEVYLSNYDDKNGAPKVSVKKSGSNYVVTLNIYEHELTGDFKPYNVLRQSSEFLFPSYPCTTDPLDPCKNIKLSPFFEDAGNLKKIIASTITTYDGEKLPLATYSWRPDALGDVYPPLNGDPSQPAPGAGWKWVKTMEVTSRQNQGVARCKNDAVTESEALGVSTTRFIGGKTCDVLGSVANATSSTANLLSGEEDIRTENCASPGECLGAFGNWERAGSTLQSLVSHTGERSIKVTSLFGPSIDMKIRERPGFMDRKKGFMVSAWMFAKPGSNPAFRVEFRDIANPPVIDHNLDDMVFEIDVVQAYIDVHQSFPTNRWVKVERLITYEELTGHGVFTGPFTHDYLRIWLGKSTATGPEVYVDDVRLYPADAVFLTRNFDATGLLTSQLDAMNEPEFLEYDAYRTMVGVRRKNGLVKNSSATKLFNE